MTATEKLVAMDRENFLYGLIFILSGIIVLISQYRNGDFDKGSKISRSTIGQFGGAMIALFGGLYFLLKSF